ncbi:pyrroline-5-carboxylate reductase [uncultured Planktomarina sp.]|jgi:pyrroline-5-carboxylate reductase|uniref:pyrroline-5-carboxylate reductase n=1 Tax=uncultured Planktomarina sp. TaxID=1538529 RepID=UPI00326043D3
MISKNISDRGLVLLGCGKMGSALLSGWLEQGIDPKSVWILDPKPSEWILSIGVRVNEMLPDDPAVVMVAVKPQMMGEALPRLQRFGSATTLFISVAAGTPMLAFEEVLGWSTPIVRAMPNTPAAVGQGITALIGNGRATEKDLSEAQNLMAAVGLTIVLQDEGQMDAVTGVSGSGPAYVFHMIETLAQAGVKQGLPADMAMQLAKATVAGAGALAMQSDESAEQLRVNVTSPNGTTQAALDVLMRDKTGLQSLMTKAVKAATKRSQELSNG